MNLNIKNKLIGAFTLLIILSTIIYYLGTANLSSLNNSLNRVVDNNAQRIILTGKIATSMQQIAARARELVITDRKDVFEESKRLIGEQQSLVDQHLEELLKLQEMINDSVEKREAQEILDEFIKNRESHQKVVYSITNTKAQWTDSTQRLASKMLIDDCRPLVMEFTKTLNKLTNLNVQRLDTIAADTDDLYSTANSSMIIIMVFSILSAILISY